MAVRCGPDRRLGTALSGQGQRTDKTDNGADADSEGRMQGGGEEGDEHRSDDEDNLIQHCLDGKCGMQQG